jgi:hypothetical protein
MCCFEVAIKRVCGREVSIILSERVLFRTVLFIAHQTTATLSFLKPASTTTHRDACAQVSDKSFCLYNPLGGSERVKSWFPHYLRVEAEERVEHGTCNTTWHSQAAVHSDGCH